MGDHAIQRWLNLICKSKEVIIVEIVLGMFMGLAILFTGIYMGRMWQIEITKKEIKEELPFGYTTDDGKFYSTTRAIEKMSTKRE